MKCSDVTRESTSYLSCELDAAIALEIDRHVSECGSCAARLAELRNLTAAIKSRGVEPMPSALEARIRARLPEQEPVRLPPLRGRRVWAVAGALAIVLALLSGLLVNRRGPSAAAEVVARAERNLHKLSAYHINWRSTSYSEDSTVVGTQRIEQWAKAPDLVRIEMTSSYAAGKTIGIMQREYAVWIDTGSQVASMWPLSQEEKERTSNMLLVESPEELARQHPSTMRVVGTTHVLGRECDVIERQLGGNKREQIAFDRTTGMLLRYVSYSGAHLMLLQEASEWEVNEPIPDALFDTSPPKGMQLIKGPVVNIVPCQSGDADMDAVALSKHLAALLSDKRAPLGLDVAYTPSYIPDGYVYQGVRWLSDASKEPVNGATPRYGITIIYIKPDTGDTLLITETNRGKEAGDREVTVQGVTGRIESMEKPFPYMIVSWTKGDVHFKVAASDMGQDEILRVAESLRELGP